MARSGIEEFVSRMQQARSDFERAVLQLNFALGTEIKKQVVKNIDNTFGQNVSADLAAYRQGASGALRQSVGIKALRDGTVDVFVGGAGVPYAAIHEYGGIITPVRKKWLTIPSNDRSKGRTARDFDLAFVLFGNNRAGLFFKDSDEMAFYLVKRVEIPARPYFAPAVEHVGKTMGEEMAERIFGRIFDGR